MKILIVDTQGPDGISDAYRALLPGVSIRGVEPAGVSAGPCHRHGAWCGYLAGLPLAACKLSAELVFVRVFDSAARWIASQSWLLSVIESEAPDYVSRSWGAWDRDDQIMRTVARLSFAEFEAGYRKLVQRLRIADFGAAGNNDDNDGDEDVAYPQADMADVSIVIGACNRRGVPCRWSGDGRGVACVMWADGVCSPDADGAWSRWSGTSAATPKACGAAAALGLDADGFRSVLQRHCDRPEDWRGRLPHPKWGWGCAEELWQMHLSGAPASILPPAAAASAAITVLDYGCRP